MSERTLEMPGKSSEKNRKGLWRPVVLIVFVAGIFVLVRISGLSGRIVELRGWIQSLGAWGGALFVLIYVAATVLAFPGAILSVAAGAAFGSVTGDILVSIGATAGAGLSFLIARYLAREPIARQFSGNEKFRRLDHLTQRYGALIVTVTRLVPIFPLNLLNYGFGLTAVPFSVYLFWTWLCTLPGIILYVGGADAYTRIATQGKIPWPLVAVLVLIVIMLIFLARCTQRKVQ